MPRFKFQTRFSKESLSTRNEKFELVFVSPDIMIETELIHLSRNVRTGQRENQGIGVMSMEVEVRASDKTQAKCHLQFVLEEVQFNLGIEIQVVDVDAKNLEGQPTS